MVRLALLRLIGSDGDGDPAKRVEPLHPGDLSARDVVRLGSLGAQVSRLQRMTARELIAGHELITPAEMAQIVRDIVDIAWHFMPAVTRADFELSLKIYSQTGTYPFPDR
jgi:hypothetical protein